MRQLAQFLLIACTATLFSTVASTGCAQNDAASQADEAAIRAAAKKYLMAKQQGDTATMSAIWTPNGDYIDATGQVHKAQDLFSDASEASSADSAELSLPKSSLRFITPDVAIEDGTNSQIIEDGGSVTGRFTAVWTKRDGRWLLDSLRDIGATSTAVDARLLPLEWLIGVRSAAIENAVILESAEWSDDGNFIERKFLVRSAKGEQAGGTQWIGWDPLREQITSWTVDGQGGSGEGVWQPTGGSWTVESTEVSADGCKAQTSCVYTPGDDGGYVWESKRVSVDGKNVPASRIEFKRATEEK
jgi:uncharacterized protein (TIGR02246 family)